MKVKNPELERVAVSQKNYPDDNLPEFALAGRSNVGKSSFINALLGRKNLARTSSTPGKTRTVNFYNVDGKLRLVDLPGYGYARVSKTERESWAHIINEYIENRESLLEIILLVDIRHEPTALDKEMYAALVEAGFSGIVVATKKDKISKGKVKAHVNEIAKALKIKNTDMIIPFSSEKREEVEFVWSVLNDVIEHYSED